jgi:hypothetical protein
MDIRQAFVVLLDTPELVAKAGLSDTNKRQFKYKLNKGETVFEDTMRKYLEAAGFKERTTWTRPRK